MRGGEEYTLDTLYDFLSENREEIGSLSIDVGPILAILEGFKERSEKGSYYIMNIEMNRADMINAEVVTKAIKKGFNGYASTSFEHQSMMRTLDETTLLKTFFTKDLPIIKAHYEFKPGAPGAVAAEASFNTAKEEKALAKEQKLAAKKAKDQQSGGRGKRTRKRRKSRRKRGGREVYESGIGQEGQAGVDEDCIDNGACKKGLQCIPGPTNTINARGTCKDLNVNVNEGGTRGKSRRKSRGKSRRRKRRKSRRRKRTGKTRKKRGGVRHALADRASNEMLEFFRNPATGDLIIGALHSCNSDKVFKCLNLNLNKENIPLNKDDFTPDDHVKYKRIIQICKPGSFVGSWPQQSGEGMGGGGKRRRKKRTKRRTRGKKRTKSRRKSRGKRRRRKRSRKRRKSRRRKNLKKQVGGGEFSENIMDIIRGDDDIIKLKTKGYNQRCTNCRGATHVLIAKLRELGVDDKYIGWGEWSGHSVAIVKDGEEIRENIKIDLESPPDDIGNYYVFDGSFHQISKDIKTDEDILFTGKLIDYYKDHYSKSWREDTKLAILPLAREVHRNWIVVEDYGWMLD